MGGTMKWVAVVGVVAAVLGGTAGAEAQVCCGPQPVYHSYVVSPGTVALHATAPSCVYFGRPVYYPAYTIRPVYAVQPVVYQYVVPAYTSMTTVAVAQPVVVAAAAPVVAVPARAPSQALSDR